MKKKFVSMLLVLTLVVTGIPSGGMIETVNAAELSEENVVFSGEEEVELLHSEAGDSYTLSISENGKAVGSDGVVYDDVAYLSAENVKALSTDAQDAYIAFCDDVAAAMSAGDGLENVVAAVDEDGTLVFHYTIPVKAIEAAIDELAESFLESDEDAEAVEEDKMASQIEEIQEDVSQTEASDDKDATKETFAESEVDEEASEEILSEEISLEEISIEETITDTVETVEIEETETDASEEENASAGEVTSEEVEEAFTEETSVEETESVTEQEMESVTETETETASEEFVLTSENMELIPELEEEHFPVVGDIKADLIVDLGYNNANSSKINQLNSILPSDNWFSKQLTKNQSVIFTASKAMGNGTNQFKFNATNKLTTRDFERAISAYIMTEPYKCDWMDLSSKGGLSIKYSYYSESDPTYDFEVNLVKSEFYNAALVNEANAKVLELAAQAQKYALKNYPNSPVYGIVKYFDKWICENNFYHDTGVSGGKAEDKPTREIYYYCHSSYGILLKGYGVCESYALTLTRCLDAIGIPNMYATGKVPMYVGGQIGYGGHAWNYIEMPDGNWYLHDSTWNDDEKKGGSTEEYLLCADDGMHIPTGNRWAEASIEDEFKNAFEFVTPSASSYKLVSEVAFSDTEINLLPKQIKELTCENAYIADKNVPKTWSSSNEKVAKVDKNGKVTAVAPGSAVITFTVAGISAFCTVNVHQIDSITFDDGGRTSYTTSCGMDQGKKVTQNITLTVNHKNNDFVYTAEELAVKGIFPELTAVSSKPEVAKVNPVLNGNTIHLAVEPLTKGSTKITVTFAGKKATLNLSVMEGLLSKEMFVWDEVDDLAGKKNPYTGKAYKPKVVLSDQGKEKKVKFKVNYLNNKDAGTASVVIVGSGEYGGQIVKTFKIEKMPLSVVAPEKIKIKDSLYNGGVNPMKGTIKNLNQYTDDKGRNVSKKVSLKVGKDYDILYTKIGTTDKPVTEPIEAGTYQMKLVGKNDYVGEYEIPGKYQITQNDIKKVKVSVKVNGTIPTVSVAIGKNELPQSDYKITYYTDKKCEKENEINGSVFLPKTQYFVKVEAAGSNLTDLQKKPIVKSFKTK